MMEDSPPTPQEKVDVSIPEETREEPDSTEKPEEASPTENEIENDTVVEVSQEEDLSNSSVPIIITPPSPTLQKAARSSTDIEVEETNNSANPTENVNDVQSTISLDSPIQTPSASPAIPVREQQPATPLTLKEIEVVEKENEVESKKTEASPSPIPKHLNTRKSQSQRNSSADIVVVDSYETRNDSITVACKSIILCHD
jgi:hypothetical protein